MMRILIRAVALILFVSTFLFKSLDPDEFNYFLKHSIPKWAIPVLFLVLLGIIWDAMAQKHKEANEKLPEPTDGEKVDPSKFTDVPAAPVDKSLPVPPPPYLNDVFPHGADEKKKDED